MSSKIAEVSLSIVKLVEELNPEERARAIAGALASFGESVSTQVGKQRVTDDVKGEVAPEGDFTSPASKWIKANSITQEQLESWFHFDNGKVSLIASSLPGTSKKQKTVNAYVLTGLAKFLTSDQPFTDEDAVSTCKHYSCLDPTNHSTYVKKNGGLISGARASGFKLTAPGLKHAAEILKAT